MSGRVVTWATALGVLWCVAIAVVHPLNSWFVFDATAVRVCLVAALVGIFLLPRARLTARVWPGALGGGLVTLLSGVLVRAQYGWDARMVLDIAQALALGAPLRRDQLHYLADYPNNRFLVAAEEQLMRLARAVNLPPVGLVEAVHILLAASLPLLVGLAVRAAGRPRAILAAQVAVTVLVGLSPMTAVPYSDVPAAALVAATLVLAVTASRARGARRIVLAVLAGGVLGLGVAIKPFVIALGVGAVVATVLRCRRPAWVPVLLALTAAAGIGTLAGVLGEMGTGYTSAELAAIAPPFPPEHFLAMGTWDSGGSSPVRRFGAYSQPQVDRTEAMTDPQQRRAELRRTIRAQVGGRTLGANLGFFAYKLAWVWGDGTFWAQGEGSDKSQPAAVRGTPLDGVAQVLRYPGRGYSEKAAAVQGTWLALLLVTAAGLVRRRRPDWLVLALAGTLAAQSGYLMAFEARSRYLVPMIPVVLLLAAVTWAEPRHGGRRATGGSVAPQ